MITITVTGGRGEGKTLTALRVVEMLRGLGFKAEYHGATEYTTRLLRGLTPVQREELFTESIDPREFQVIDRA